MFVAKQRRVMNPHSSRPRRKSARRNAHRRRMTAKQIRHFGTKAQRAALKRRTKVVRQGNRSTPRRKNSKRRRGTSKRNPVHLLNLGYLNPHRKGAKMAAKKRRRRAKARRSSNPRRRRYVMRPTHRRRRRRATSNPRRYHRHRNRRRRNYTKVVVMRPRRRHNRRHRNPTFFGANVRITKIAQYVAGGLAGVAITKAAMPLLPAMLTNSNAMKTVSAIGVALAAGWLASRMNPDFGSAVLFGGLMEAGSVFLNAFIPPAGRYLALSGLGYRRRGMLGDFVPGHFTIPENPVLLTGTGGAGGPANVGPKRRAYGNAY